jgi:hypothetical protein
MNPRPNFDINASIGINRQDIHVPLEAGGGMWFSAYFGQSPRDDPERLRRGYFTAPPEAYWSAFEQYQALARTTGSLLAAGLEQCARHGGLAVNYDELPEAIGGRLSDLLGLDAADAATALTGLRDHAKRPGEAFEPDRARKREAAGGAVREQVERWAVQPYLALDALRARQSN